MDNLNKRDFILNGKMAKVIMTLSAPIMLNNFIQTIYNLTDTYFVSKLGEVELNAVGFIWPIIFFMMSFGLGVSIAGTALISQYIGSNDTKSARKVSGQILSFSFIFSVVFGLIGALFAPNILKIMGASGLLLKHGSDFLRIIFLGMPTMFLFFAFNSIKQGQGDTITPMKFGAMSVGLNIILDPIFIFTLDLGVSGAAIATVLARGIFAIFAVYSLFKENNGFRIKISDLILDKKLLLKIIKIGLPSSIGQSTAALGFAVLNIFVISFGDSTLNAFIIGNRINSLILMPAMGIGASLATIVGQNLGADNIPRAKNAVKTSMILSTLISIAGGTLILIFAENVVRLFTDEPEIIKLGTFYLRLISGSIPLMGIFQNFIGTFQGSGHTLSAMVMMMGRLWAIRIPSIWILKTFTNLGSNSVWYAMVFSNAIICMVGLGIYKTGKWQHKVIKKSAA